MVPTVFEPAHQGTYYASGAIGVLRFVSIRIMFDSFETFPGVTRKSWSIEILSYSVISGLLNPVSFS
jgi:hypothetical protein